MLPFEPIERVVESTVTSQAAGLTLLQYLVKRYDYLKEPQWAEQLSAGNLSVNNEVANADTILAANDLIYFQARGLVEQEVSWDIHILAENDDYLIVNKPGNLPCHPAGRFFNHTLWAWLKQLRKLPSIHFVNRLDRETSGLVLVAKTPRFAATAAKLLHSLGVEAYKTYDVLVHGRVPWPEFIASGWLGKDTASEVLKKRRFFPVANDGVSDSIELPEDEEAQPCQTDFVHRGFCSPCPTGGGFVLDEAGEFTWLEARLHTGRTHQIRATLCSLGFPVVGDKLYGVDDQIFLRLASGALTDDDFRRLILPNQALHARHLKLPRLGIDVTVPPPFISAPASLHEIRSDNEK